jgi:NADH-quinone oxidoreductase subunit I
VCPFDAIKMDQEYELATDSHDSLTIDRVGLLRPVSYYESLAPGMWAEVSEGALKKLENAIKRRPAGVGRADGAASGGTIAGAQPVAPATNMAITAQIEQLAKVDPRDASVDFGTSEPAAVDSAPPLDPAAAKAAKLAAIRAANAAKAAQGAAAEPIAQADVATESALVPSADAPPLDPAAAKAAKLAAIRAANAAKKAQQNPDE